MVTFNHLIIADHDFYSLPTKK
ncbi:MAG: hypothetical protein U0X71_02085 [Sphingobacteriaceae bacterium]